MAITPSSFIAPTPSTGIHPIAFVIVYVLPIACILGSIAYIAILRTHRSPSRKEYLVAGCFLAIGLVIFAISLYFRLRGDTNIY